MSRLLLALVFFGLLPGQAGATPNARAVLSPGEQCRAGIAAAEQAHGIPAQLMAAIGRVESGRRDPGTGSHGAWPWTINAEGQGYYFETKSEAIAAVEGLRARGVRSIDVGCMQVNLMHHAAAFATLDQAFEPSVNADYAARFLVRLHDQTGDWTKATANYHSANPALGEPYASKVMSVWPEEQRKSAMAQPTAITATPNAGGFFGGAMPMLLNQPPVKITTASAPAMAPGQPPAISPGRGLDAYRAMPIRMAVGMPPRMMR